MLELLKIYNRWYTGNAVQIKHEIAVRGYGVKLSAKAQHDLKIRIWHRIWNEDYTCRLPKLRKPVVRHKLRLYVYEYGGYVASVWR